MAYRRKLDKDIRCPLEYGLDVFGGKWKSRILCVLSDGQLRYSELRNEMADVTDAALAIALKDLAGNGLIERRQYEEIPPRVEYRLTKMGESLFPVVQAAHVWAIDYVLSLPEDQAPITDKMRPPYRRGWSEQTDKKQDAGNV